MHLPVDPVGLPGLAAMMTGLALFALALLVARVRKTRSGDAGEQGGARSHRSWAGVTVQGFGIFVAAFGPLSVGLDPMSAKALAEGAVVAILMGTSVWLFVWATATMGRNWSLVARTRSDHSLVTTGPFAWMRHPIYTAMALVLLSFAVAYGHASHLPLAIAVFALGTWMRIRDEERLLRDAFGADYDEYAKRVKRFVPSIF